VKLNSILVNLIFSDFIISQVVELIRWFFCEGARIIVNAGTKLASLYMWLIIIHRTTIPARSWRKPDRKKGNTIPSTSKTIMKSDSNPTS